MTSIRFAWFSIIVLATLALSMFFSAIVQGSPSSLVERLVAAQKPFQSKTEQSVDPVELATAIASSTKGDRGWAALLLTTAASESALSARIARGDCMAHECDHGRAWSLYQIHANAQNAAVWGSTNLQVQTTEALRMLRQAGARCHSFRHIDRATCVVRAYAGSQPDLPIKGEEQRMQTYQRIVGRL